MEAGSDLTGYLGQVIPVRFEPPLLVLSYLVSLVGAASTLELMQRRTSRRGYSNNLLLLGASITSGGVSIWSMHYIGNRATTLLNGEPELQVVYSAGVTVASFFLPVLVLLFAFFVVPGSGSSGNRIIWWRVGASGLLSGAAICGMHYLGNASIRNYQCEYKAANVAGSAVIAAAASTIALAFFFVSRNSWTNSWWKRLACAVLLAGAASGMHWCAVLGTKFTLMHLNSSHTLDSRNRTVIVTACLSFAACLIIAGIAIYSARVRMGYASRARRITLAAAVFDEHGRILVTPDGLLPSEVVTSAFLQKTRNETFSTAHPLFLWLFQASRSWTSISPLLDKMRRHLADLPRNGRNLRTGIELVDKEGHIIDNYDTIFCELFCVAAAALAHRMHEDLVDAGILWDEIFGTGGHPTTGHMSRGSDASQHSILGVQTLSDLAEKGMMHRGRDHHGHLMFLVRRVDTSRADRLAASGYFFAEPRQVASIIGSRMQIRAARLEDKLTGMERYSCGVARAPGVHVGMFAVKTQLHPPGFEVLVRGDARNLLPSIQLPLDRLEPAQVEFIRSLGGCSLGSVLRRLERADKITSRHSDFPVLFRDAVQDLRDSVQDPIFDGAKLMPKVAQVPCAAPSGSIGQGPASMCSLIAFTLMIPIHDCVDAATNEFIPLPFFKTQQLVYDNTPHKAAFARSVHRKFSPTLHTASAPFGSGSTLLWSRRLRDWVPLPGSHLFAPLTAPRNNYSPIQPRRRHADTDRFISSPTWELTALTPCNGSVSSLPLHPGGIEEVGRPESRLAEAQPSSEVYGSESAGFRAWWRRLQQQKTQQKQPAKLPLGGIMISQEVTVDVEEVGDTSPTTVLPDIPPPASARVRDRTNTAPSLAAQALQQTATSMSGSYIPPPFDQAIELNKVSALLGTGSSKVEVKREGDEMTVTFVDELFSSCLDTPKPV